MAGSLAAPSWWWGWRGHEPLGIPPPAVLPGPAVLSCVVLLFRHVWSPGTLHGPSCQQGPAPAVLWLLGFPSHPVPRRMILSHRSFHDRAGYIFSRTASYRDRKDPQLRARPCSAWDSVPAQHFPSPITSFPISVSSWQHHPSTRILPSHRPLSQALRLEKLGYDNPPQWNFQGQEWRMTSVMGWRVLPPPLCYWRSWNPNPEYLWTCSHLGVGPWQVIKLRWGHWRGPGTISLVSSDRTAYSASSDPFSIRPPPHSLSCPWLAWLSCDKSLLSQFHQNPYPWCPPLFIFYSLTPSLSPLAINPLLFVLYWGLSSISLSCCNSLE